MLDPNPDPLSSLLLIMLLRQPAIIATNRRTRDNPVSSPAMPLNSWWGKSFLPGQCHRLILCPLSGESSALVIQLTSLQQHDSHWTRPMTPILPYPRMGITCCLYPVQSLFPILPTFASRSSSLLRQWSSVYLYIDRAGWFCPACLLCPQGAVQDVQQYYYHY